MKITSVIPLLALAFASRAAGTAQAAGSPRALPAQVLAAPLYGARDLGPIAAGTRVDFSIVLPYRNATELAPLLAAQQSLRSPYYRHFLSAAQFRAYFAPTTATYEAQVRKLSDEGFRVTTFANRTVLHASGTATEAERLFKTRIDTVRQAGGRLAYANVAPATIPASFAGARVVGLSNVVVARTTVGDRLASPRSASSFGGTLFGPDGGYGPSALAKVEDFPVEHGYRGSNSNVADLIDGSVADSDVAAYLDFFGIKRGGPRTTTRAVDGGCVTGCVDGLQATVDAESILGVAPDASLFTYEGPSPFTTGFIADGFNAIVSDDAVNVVNSSIGACEINLGDLQLAIQPIIAQGAAEGITFESVAFGGADSCGLGVDLPVTPANLDTVTAVGGSNQIVDDSGKLLAQSAFRDSNGGVSVTVPVPAWQAATKGVNRAGRNVPDLVVPADVDGVGPSLYYAGIWQGGFAFVNNAPFAGYLATVQQYYGYTTPLGNVAPALYSVFDADGYKGGSAAYFDDISLGNIGSVGGEPVVAKAGYDLATGIGSIQHGFALMKALGYKTAAVKK